MRTSLLGKAARWTAVGIALSLLGAGAALQAQDGPDRRNDDGPREERPEDDGPRGPRAGNDDGPRDHRPDGSPPPRRGDFEGRGPGEQGPPPGPYGFGPREGGFGPGRPPGPRDGERPHDGPRDGDRPHHGPRDMQGPPHRGPEHGPPHRGGEMGPPPGRPGDRGPEGRPGFGQGSDRRPMGPPPFAGDFRGPQRPGFGGSGRGASEIERRLDEIERKIDRILDELKRSDVGRQDRDEDRREVIDAPIYDELTLDEAGFESY